MNLPREASFGVCPTANFCEITAGQGSPACGSIPEHLVPLALAEELCPRALVRYVANKRAEPAEEFMLSGPKKDLSLGWYELELAMQPKIDGVKAAAHFEAADAYARKISSAPGVTFPLKMDAELLRLYLPTFMARRRGQRQPDGYIGHVRKGLNHLYESLQTAEPHTQRTHPGHLSDPDHQPCLIREVDRQSLGAKLALFMLAARAGIVAYPASDREAKLHTPEEPLYHHDAYILDQERKLPIKIRLEPESTTRSQLSRYGKSILYIALRPLISSTMVAKGFRLRAGDREAMPQQLTSWLNAEFRGQPITNWQREILDGVMEELVSRLEDFRSPFYAPGERRPPISPLYPKR